MCSYISNTVNRMYKDICFLLFSVNIVSELSSATSDRFPLADRNCKLYANFNTKSSVFIQRKKYCYGSLEEPLKKFRSPPGLYLRVKKYRGPPELVQHFSL